ncbi:MAG: serine hydrolase [Sphingomicrobium sp.]
MAHLTRENGVTGIRALMAAFLMLVTVAPAIAEGVEPLIGLWGANLDFGPRLRGDLVVRRTEDGWTASIGGQRVNFKRARSEVRFQFGHGDGFRGIMSGTDIQGFWIQPADSRDPGGSGQHLATPLTLHPAGPGVWRGRVAPLDRQFTLWLSIFRAPDGSLTAAFRNPQANSNGGTSRFQLTQSGDALHFAFKREGGDIVHDARLLHSPDRIRIRWEDVGQTIDLVRRDPAQAKSFWPRLPGTKNQEYRRPIQTSDGWHTARAAATGMDEAVLAKIIEERATLDPTARPPQLLHSLLVAHRGRLVLEEYFFGTDSETTHDIRSAGKTFGSVLLGTAEARRAGLGTESRIYEIMKARGPFANPDPRKAQITLAHLMTQTSGLECNDNDDASRGNEGTMQAQTGQPDWWRYTLDLPVAHAPGERYAYCSANSNLIGGALTEATGIWLPELFRTQIAEPLQFGGWHWNLAPNGEGYLGGGAFLRSRDFLKIGQLYLNGGTWNGKRVVPADWVKLSTRPRIDVNPTTTALSEEDFDNFYIRGQDALAWHPGCLRSGSRTYATYAATGNGGQILLVIPEVELAVVLTGGNYGQGGVWTRWAQQIVGDRIIPAIIR